jgi:hypothetical protein
MAERYSQSFDEEDYTALLPENIEQSWINRYGQRALFYTAGFFNAFFWIVFCIPVIEMAWILSRSGTQAVGPNIAICIFVLGGAFTEWLSHFFWIGVTAASFTLSNYFNLDQWLRSDVAANLGLVGDDGIGWRDLEVNHVVTSGLIWIVDSFEWVCLGGVFTCAFVSVYRWRQDELTAFSPRWNALGLFIGLLSFIEFGAEMARFDGYKVATPIVLLYAALTRIILIPAWILSLGYQLPKATAKHFETHVAYNLEETEGLRLTEQADPLPPTFTIDDDDRSGGLAPPVATGPSSPPAEAFAANRFISSPEE